MAAIGLIMIPVMVNAGYDKPYSASLVATAGTIGTIIPPSVCMVVYAVAANASVTSLFTAGFPVGIITGIALCVYSYFVAKKRKYYPKEVNHYTGKEIWKIFVDAIPSLLIPVLVLGSIYGGICTPTEAAAFACFVGIIISCFVYKEVKISELPYLGFRAVMLCTPVLFVIGMSSGFGKVLAIADIPTMIAEAILGLTTNKIDRFGEEVSTVTADDGHFKAIVEVAPSPPFFAWVFTFCGKIQILGPAEVLDEMRGMAAWLQ